MDANPTPSATSSLALRFLDRRSVTLTFGVTSAAAVLLYFLHRRQRPADKDMTSKTEMTSTSTPIKGQKEKVEVAEEAFAKYRLKENLSDTPETSWVEEVEKEISLEEMSSQKEATHQLDECKLSSELEKLNIKDKMTLSAAKVETVSVPKKIANSNGSPVRNKVDSGVVSPTAEEDENLAKETNGERKPKSRSDSTDGGLGGSLNGEDDPERQAALSDSGQGSETAEEIVEYHFMILNFYCGKFIGVKGAAIISLKNLSKCSINLETPDGRPSVGYKERDPNEYQRVIIEGTRNNIDKCLDIIRERFPLDQFPEITLEQVNSQPGATSSTANSSSHGNQQKSNSHGYGNASGKGKSRYHSAPIYSSTAAPYDALVDGSSHSITVQSIMSGCHVAVTLSHNYYTACLLRLEECMQHVYSMPPAAPTSDQPRNKKKEREAREKGAPPLVENRPVPNNLICVALCENKWYRVQVMSWDQYSDTCQVKFVDYGGYSFVAVSDLRQIRSDFMNLPFLAVEVVLANICPCDGATEWSLESTEALSNIVSNKTLRGNVCAFTPDCVPVLELYVEGEGSSSSTSVSRTLVEGGHAQWLEPAPVDSAPE